VVRARSLAATPLIVHVNDQPIADLALGGRAFETLRVNLPAGVLRAGDNELQLRVTRTGSAPGVPSAGLLLDWIRLSPAGETASDAAPPSLAALRGVAGDGAPAGLRLPKDAALGYALEVPEGAVLVGALEPGSAGTLQLTALRDGAPPLALGEIAPGSTRRVVDVPLGALSGSIARIELRAQGGPVTLSRVRVETPRTSAVLPAPPPAKNAIVILIDTLRADALSPYKPSTRVKTPGLDTFLGDAAVMRNARTQENWTKPSVATLLSSLLPWQHEAVTGDARLPASVELLPELLAADGYYTGAFIANGYVSDKFGFKQGWSTYRNYIREGRRSPAQYVVADVLEWLDARPKDKPFFLYVHTIDPHVPYKPPGQFLSMYDSEPYSGPVDFRQTGDLLERVKIGKVRLGARDKTRLRALYDAEITYHDVHFAALVQGLKERGLETETVIAITADHGEEFWDHGSVGHGHSVYDELLHVPLVMRVPGLTQHKQVLDEAVGLVDVMPTVLDALGKPIPEHLVGRSILPDLRGQGGDAPRAAVSGFMRGWRTVGVGNYKLVQRTLAHAFVYDVKADPGETKDLAGERPIALRYLRGVLGLTLIEQGDDRGPARTARKHKAEKTAIDAKTEAQLRALGYVGTSAP
jgi:arylsulfatase A-like enzyme